MQSNIWTIYRCIYIIAQICKFSSISVITGKVYTYFEFIEMFYKYVQERVVCYGMQFNFIYYEIVATILFIHNYEFCPTIITINPIDYFSQKAHLKFTSQGN